MRLGQLVALVATTLTAGTVAATPAGATHGGSDGASCVAWFVGEVPAGHRGEVISYGAATIRPFGSVVVSNQATSPRDDCIEFDV